MKSGRVGYTCNPHAGGERTEASVSTGFLSQPIYVKWPGPGRDHISDNKVQEDSQHWPLASTCVCTGEHTPQHLHMHVHTYTWIKKKNIHKRGLPPAEAGERPMNEAKQVS